MRASTDLQQYSIENQAAVIAAYAQAHNLQIVHIYADEAESGLGIKNRPGLIGLIQDIQENRADFNHILVFDVSRWGRFQDVDESAHYEFICKQAGIKVAYCAEQFDNDGSLISSIVKNIKRVMAAEYSRELSAKVHAGACRFARLGFKVGGPLGYGLQRQLVNENSEPKAILKPGQRKYLSTDHIRVCPGTVDQIPIVRWIFQEFLRKNSASDIARELNRRNVTTNSGRPWNCAMIGRLLRNEAYIGNLVYNRRSRRLQERDTYNPPDLWIRSEGCVEPIIDENVFLRAKRVLESRCVRISEEEMLKRLRRALMKKGRLSASIIDQTAGLPSVVTYLRHFGGLRNAYRLIGYDEARHRDYLEERKKRAEINASHASLLRAAFEKAGGHAIFDPSIECLRVNGSVGICFQVAPWQAGKDEGQAPRWTLRRRARSAATWIVAARLGERNEAVLDYILLRATELTGPSLKFSEKTGDALGMERFETFVALTRSLVSRLVKPRAAAPSSRQRLDSSQGATRARTRHCGKRR